MRLLALDTSSLACSVALQFDEQLAARHEEQAREHTKLLVPMIRSVLDDVGTRLADLDAIVLGNGPGSFIGMRIAASVAQGLAFGAGLGIVPVSSMAAVAAEVLDRSEAGEVAVAQDAHMNEVYLGIYRRGDGGMPVDMIDERLQPQAAIPELDAPGGGPRAAAGFGWRRYPELLALNEDRLDAVSEVLYPDARYLLPLGAQGLLSAGALAPEDVNPAYLRQKVAQKPSDGRP